MFCPLFLALLATLVAGLVQSMSKRGPTASSTAAGGAPTPLKAKRGKGEPHPGSEEFNGLRSSFPPGASSLEELFAWEQQIAQDLFRLGDDQSALRRHRLSLLSKGGVLVFSDHGGTGNGEAGAKQALEGLGPEVCPIRPVIYCPVDPFEPAQLVLDGTAPLGQGPPPRLQGHLGTSSGILDQTLAMDAADQRHLC